MRPRSLAVVMAVAWVAVAGGARPAEAQSGREGWQTLASGDEVLALALSPTDSGTLLAGTEGGGLVEWDLRSHTFQQFLFPQQPGLDSNQVRDIAFDVAGNAWLATANGVTVTGRDWHTYHQADGLPSDDVTAVAVASNGTVWVGTRRRGLAELPNGTGAWVVHSFDEDALGPGANRIADIALDANDRVWVAHGRATSGSQPALSVFDPSTAAWTHIESAGPGGDDTKPATDQILALDFDASGTLWAGSWAEGVLSFDGATWTQASTRDGVCDDKVWAVNATSQVWVACGDDTGGRGVSHWDGASWSTLTTSDGLPTDTVTSIAQVGGVAYLGTNGPGDFGSGIVPVAGFVDAALTTSVRTMAQNDLTAVAFDDQGNVWLGSHGAGLFVRRNGTWTTFTRESTGGGLTGDLITDLLWYDGRLWVATTRSEYQAGVGYIDGGLSVYDPASDAWTSWTAATSGLPSDQVSSVSVDQDGNIWVGLGVAEGDPGDEAGGVQSGRGIAVLDPAAGDFISQDDYDSTGGGIAGNTVVGLAAGQGETWAATSYHIDSAQRRRGGGASLFTGGSWQPFVGGAGGFESYHGSGNPDNPDPYITGDVRSVAVGADGTAWAGTWDLTSGALSQIWPYVDAVVNHYDGAMWTAETWPGSGWVSAIAVDGAGRAWAGTTRGHDLREYSLSGGSTSDTAVGGVHVWQAGYWTGLTPEVSGLASTAITDVAVDPVTGDVWFATENEGASILLSGVVPPTVTPGGPTVTPRPSATMTRSYVVTNTPVPQVTAPPGSTAGPIGPPIAPTRTPKPPSEVPEPATILLMSAGLAGLAAWRRRRNGTEVTAEE